MINGFRDFSHNYIYDYIIIEQNVYVNVYLKTKRKLMKCKWEIFVILLGTYNLILLTDRLKLIIANYPFSACEGTHTIISLTEGKRRLNRI